MRIAFLLQTRTPAHGLTEEANNTYVAVLAPSSTDPLASAPYVDPAPKDQVGFQLIPTKNGFVVGKGESGAVGDTFTNYVSAFDTSAKLTASTRDKSSCYVSYDGYVCANGPTYEMHDLLGNLLKTAGGCSNPGVLAHGFMFDCPSADKPGVYYYDPSVNQVHGPMAPYLGGGLTENVERFGATSGNSYDGKVLLKKDGSDDKFLKVVDLSTGRELLSLDNAKINGLKFELDGTYIGGNYLYASNGTDDPVIDFNDSKQVHSGWTKRALCTLANGWVAIAYETPNTRGNRDMGLVRASSGPYNGPWF